MPLTETYIGLMTGTSVDSVDVVALEVGNEGSRIALIGTHTNPIEEGLRTSIFNISRGDHDNLHDVAILDNSLADLFAAAIEQLLEKIVISADRIRAIGSHGQTVRHRPLGPSPYTVQLGNPHRLAEKTGITTIADFRQRDVAAGGQGAPLAPAFHQKLFSHPYETVVALNLGGIANISIIPPDGNITGMDTGPANTLMDRWIAKSLSRNYDSEGTWASEGKPHKILLERLLNEPWLNLPPPKSTGTELFNPEWLEQKLFGLDIEAVDIQRTLCEFTAISVSQVIKKYAADSTRLILCGGGAYNTFLRSRLAAHLPKFVIETSSEYGIDPEWIEAAAFAWLAYRTLHHLPGNIPSVTGASHPVILGAIYPGSIKT